MSKDKKDKDALNITDEKNLKEQFEFGLNEDKREEVEKDGHRLPGDEEDKENDSDKDKNDEDDDEKEDDSDKDKDDDDNDDKIEDTLGQPSYLDYK